MFFELLLRTDSPIIYHKLKESSFEKFGHMINPLTLGAFCQKCIFGHFGDFQSGNGPN